MKLMKKLMVILVAVLMVMSMTNKVFADVTPATDRTTETDGSVTVNPANTGQVYTLYLLFDADMGANGAITYTLPSGKTAADLTYGTGNNAKSWFELNSNGFVVAKSSTGEDWAKDPDAIAWAKSFGKKIGNSITAGTVSWTGLAYGYYFVDTTLGSFIGVDSANKEAVIKDKNDKPTLDKEITGVGADGVTTTLGTGANTNDPGQGANERAIAQVGEVVNFKLTVAAKPGAVNYVVKDTLPVGLTAPSATAVTVSSGATSCSVDVTGQVITVTFEKAFLDTITANTNITITYSATVNSSAEIGATGNPNTAVLTWGKDNLAVNKAEDDSTVYTGKITVIKNDDKGAGLKDAEFALKNADGKYYAVSNGVVTWVDAVANATKFTSGSDGKLNGEFTGLANGSYVLEETVVPEGYNAVDPNDSSLKFTIAPTTYTDANLIQSTTVVNTAGTVLPATGGIGTTIFHVAGAALALGAGIILISKKRMNNN